MKRNTISVAFLLALFCSKANAQPWFTGVGEVPGTGGLPSYAFGISGDGSIIVGYGGATQIQTRAFRWTLSTGTLSLGSLTGGNGITHAWSANADGTVIVGSGVTGATGEAFRWTEVGGLKALGLFPGSWSSSAQAVSGDGNTIVGWGFTNSGGREAFRWTQATGMLGLGDLPGGEYDSYALDVSDDGRAVGYATGLEGVRAMTWPPTGGFEPLIHPGFQRSEAYSTSPDGKIMVGSAYSVNVPQTQEKGRAVLWNGSKPPMYLGHLPDGRWGLAWGVNADGGVVVGEDWLASITSGEPRRAFLWTPDAGTLDLRQRLMSLGVPGLDDWILTGASGVSDDGLTICGGGINPGGNYEGWVAHLGSLPCYADCDMSSTLNIFDYICFSNAYWAQEPFADCDKNGTFSIFDYSCFSDKYASGCP